MSPPAKPVTTATFADHFGRSAEDYSRFRPRYSRELFAWLADLAPRQGTAWDCATGSGQAASGLAAHFRRVVATDASRAQLRAAEHAARVHYAAALAEAAPLRQGSLDLVAVAQALHWFRLPEFIAQVDHAIAPDGVLAVWAYGMVHVTPAVDRVVSRFYEETVGPYWPAERRLVERGYADLELPIAAVGAPQFRMEATLSQAELTGYLGTWSATARYRKERGEDPIPAVARELATVWGGPDLRRPVSWPLAVRAGQWLGSRYGSGPTKAHRRVAT